eukprot:gene22707-9144_t
MSLQDNHQNSGLTVGLIVWPSCWENKPRGRSRASIKQSIET